MQLFMHLLSRVGYFLFFLLLEIVAIFFMYSGSSFHQTIVGERIIAVNGYFLSKISDVKQYNNLPEENASLMEENARLKNSLEAYTRLKNSLKIKGIYPVKYDSMSSPRFQYLSARVIDHSIRKRDNYFMIDKGTKDGVQPNMAVLTSKGLVGAILQSTEHYSTVLSVLHSQTNIKAKLKNVDYFGILKWNGEDHRFLQLAEIPKYLRVKKGDTIVTAGESAIYPEGHMIGFVSKLKPNDKTGDYDISVQTFEDLATVNNVYVVKDFDRLEIEKVQQTQLDVTE